MTKSADPKSKTSPRPTKPPKAAPRRRSARGGPTQKDIDRLAAVGARVALAEQRRQIRIDRAIEKVADVVATSEAARKRVRAALKAALNQVLGAATTP